MHTGSKKSTGADLSAIIEGLIKEETLRQLEGELDIDPKI